MNEDTLPIWKTLPHIITATFFLLGVHDNAVGGCQLPPRIIS